MIKFIFHNYLQNTIYILFALFICANTVLTANHFEEDIEYIDSEAEDTNEVKEHYSSLAVAGVCVVLVLAYKLLRDSKVAQRPPHPNSGTISMEETSKIFFPNEEEEPKNLNEPPKTPMGPIQESDSEKKNVAKNEEEADEDIYLPPGFKGTVVGYSCINNQQGHIPLTIYELRKKKLLMHT